MDEAMKDTVLYAVLTAVMAIGLVFGGLTSIPVMVIAVIAIILLLATRSAKPGGPKK